MQAIKDNDSLAKAIAHLENVQTSEWNLLKQHFHFTAYSLNPLNMIKEKFNNTFSSPDLKSNLLKVGLGVATGLVTNQFILGSSSSILKKAIVGLVQNALPKLTIGNPETLKTSGISFLKNVLTKMKIKS